MFCDDFPQVDGSVMKQILVCDCPDVERAKPDFEQNLRSSVSNMSDLANRGDGHTSLRRARPLTFVQEVLVVAAAFVFGAVPQMLVILNIGGILE